MLLTGHLDDYEDLAVPREFFLPNDNSSRIWKFPYPRLRMIMEGIIHIVKTIPNKLFLLLLVELEVRSNGHVLPRTVVRFV